MKKIILTLLCVTVSSFATKAQEKQPQIAAGQTATADLDAGKFKFSNDTHDFGEIPEGPLAEYDFVFRNSGKKPILINKAYGSCGCTVASWPKEPVMPGKREVIHVTYNTTGRPGPIQKEVFINSNADQPQMVLHIRGTVKPKTSVSDPATMVAPK